MKNLSNTLNFKKQVVFEEPPVLTKDILNCEDDNLELIFPSSSSGTLRCLNFFARPISGTTRDLGVRFNGEVGFLSSSERYKKSIKDLPLRYLENLLKLRPVEFSYKDELNRKEDYNKPEVGLIAEEVNKVLPEIVIKDDNQVVQSVEYSKLIPLLLRQIQILTRKITNLENKA